MGKKRIWLWIAAAVLCAACVLTACFWDAIVVYAAPKAVLSEALAEALSDLDLRFRYNPVRNLLDLYSPEGRYTAAITLETDTELLGSVSCDLQANTDAVSHRFLADGKVTTSGGDLNLSLYLDGECMAVSSRELVNGNYYGIQYDSFAADMERFWLVKPLIPAATFQKWEENLNQIQTAMNRPYSVPEISQEDVRMLMTGVLLLDSKVSREAYNGLDCYCITYAAGGSQVKELLSCVLDAANTQTADISASFYLYEKQLIGIDIRGTAGENTVRYSLDLGQQCGTSDLQFTQFRTENGVSSSAVITVSTASADTLYRETVLCDITDEGGARRTEVSYSWNSNNGDMTLSWNKAMPIRMNVTRSQEGLHIVTQDFAQLMEILAGQTGDTTNEVSCTMTLTPGTEIKAPKYIPMSRWSSEDLLTLLKGLGGLIGFSF